MIVDAYGVFSATYQLPAEKTKEAIALLDQINKLEDQLKTSRTVPLNTELWAYVLNAKVIPSQVGLTLATALLDALLKEWRTKVADLQVKVKALGSSGGDSSVMSSAAKIGIGLGVAAVLAVIVWKNY